MYKNISKIVSYVCVVVLLSLFTLQQVSADNTINSSKEIVQTIESFIIETYSKNTEGLSVHNGYEVVNSITTITSLNNTITSSIQSIADQYDLNGNYLETVISSSDAENDFVSGEGKGRTSSSATFSSLNANIDLKEFIANEDVFKKVELSDAEQKMLLKKIGLYVSDLPKVEYEAFKGITYREIQTIKDSIQDMVGNNITTQDMVGNNITTTNADVSECPTSDTPGVEACGAWDNYYRHNIVNGDFTVQALCCANIDSMYGRVHGNIGGDTDRVKRLSEFKKTINTYEKYVVEELNANTFNEIVGWASAIASFVLLAQGFLTGPPGWVSIVLNAINAATVFAGFTSSLI